jgi:hypothetical protein
MADTQEVLSPVAAASGAGASSAGHAGSPTSADAAPGGGGEPAAAYLTRHGVHFIVDRLVRGILDERPDDAAQWMQRWLLEEHRQQCAKKHSMSPLAKRGSASQQQSMGNLDTAEGSAFGGGAADEADGVARPLEDEIGDE